MDILSLGEPPVSTSAATNSLTGFYQTPTKDPFAASLMDLADPPLSRGGQSAVGPRGSLLDTDSSLSGVDGEGKGSLLDDPSVTSSRAQTSRRESLLDDFEIAPNVPASTSGEFESLVGCRSWVLSTNFGAFISTATGIVVLRY